MVILMRKLAQTVLVLLVAGAATPAFAGRGATYGSIMDAIASGNGDVIAAELERAEYVVCSACEEPVMELLDSSSFQVREAAAWWVARRPALAAAVTLQSVARIQGGDAKAAEYAADVVGSLRHPGVLPVLGSALKRADFPAATKAAVARAIGTIGDPDGLPAVAGALADSGAATRVEAVRAYAALRGTRTGTELAPLLGDADATVRREAAATIGQFKVAAARPALENLLLHDQDPQVRRNAAFALKKLGDPASRAALQQAASSDPVMYVRSFAQAGLSGR
jgi:HEAT repeat protein